MRGKEGWAFSVRSFMSLLSDTLKSTLLSTLGKILVLTILLTFAAYALVVVGLMFLLLKTLSLDCVGSTLGAMAR